MTINFGTQKQVEANGVHCLVVELTDSTAVAFYNVSAASLRATHLTITAGVITLGTELTIDSNNIFVYAATKLSSTQIMLVYGYTSGTIRRARIISVSGTTLTANAVTNLTDALLTTTLDNIGLATISSTAAILVYTQSTLVGKARVLTVSGTTITENASFQYNATPLQNKVAVLSATKAVVLFANTASSDRPTAEVLDIAGTTITGNAELEINTDAVDTTSYGSISIGALDATHLIATWNVPASSSDRAVILTESGGSLSNGSVHTFTPTNRGVGSVSVAVLSSNKALHVRLTTGNEISFDELDISGTTITQTDTQTKSVSASTSVCWMRPLSSSQAVSVWEGTTEAISLDVIVPDLLTLAPMTKPADVDAAGAYIYVALLNNGTPILTKISTALNADGTTVFDPGAGDNIGVECGRFNSDVVWVAGQFNGTNVVEKSEDGGTSFSVADSGAIGGIRSFVMGPDSDDRILVFDEDNGDLLETIDGGTNWTTINATVTPEVNAIGRFGKNVQETVFGNQGAANNNVDYSVNSGADLEDFVLPVNQDVTGVIVN